MKLESLYFTLELVVEAVKMHPRKPANKQPKPVSQYIVVEPDIEGPKRARRKRPLKLIQKNSDEDID